MGKVIDQPSDPLIGKVFFVIVGEEKVPCIFFSCNDITNFNNAKAYFLTQNVWPGWDIGLKKQLPHDTEYILVKDSEVGLALGISRPTNEKVIIKKRRINERKWILKIAIGIVVVIFILLFLGFLHVL